MKYGTNEHIYVCVYLIASSKGKYIDEASERKKRRMCKKKKDSLLIRMVRGMKIIYFILTQQSAQKVK